MERNATFATMVSTGEKPDAVIHMALFDDGDKAQVIGEQKGGGRDLSMLVAQTVARMVESLQEKDSATAAAAFVMIVMNEMTRASNEETNKCTNTFMMKELEESLGKLIEDDEEEE